MKQILWFAAAVALGAVLSGGFFAYKQSRPTASDLTTAEATANGVHLANPEMNALHAAMMNGNGGDLANAEANANVLAHLNANENPDDLDYARSKASVAGSFTVSIEPESGEIIMGPLHSWVVTVQTADGEPINDATVTINGGMPQHGHGLPTQPQITGLIGEGRYRLEGVKFSMNGWWVLRLTIEAAGQNDTVIFNVEI